MRKLLEHRAIWNREIKLPKYTTLNPISNKWLKMLKQKTQTPPKPYLKTEALERPSQ